jgi:hypothetical protein
MLRGAYREDDTCARLELREKIEQLLPRRVFVIQQTHAARRFLVGGDFCAGFDPIAKQLASHIARSDSHPRVATDAFRFTRIPLAVDVECLRMAAGGIAREPYRSTDTLTVFAKGFEVQISVVLKYVEIRSGAHLLFDVVTEGLGKMGASLRKTACRELARGRGRPADPIERRE